MNISRVIRLKEGEIIQAVVRNWWPINLGTYVLAGILLAGPFFFMIPLFAWRELGSAVIGVSLLAGALLGLRTFYLWYWNVFVITSERVVDIDQRGFFDRVVSEAPYDRIQDVSYRVKGVFGTVFHFGAIVVQTAGATANLEMPHVPAPEAVQHLITAQMSSYLERLAVRSERASGLIEAAATMSDTEARAFVTELQVAMKPNEAPHRSAESKKVTDIKLPDDWRDESDRTETLKDWRKRGV